MKKLFKCKVSHDKLNLDDDLTEYIKTLNGKEVEVTIQPWRSTRSNQQNRYYWGVVINILSNELGYFPEEMHQVLKEKFLKVKDVIINEERFTIVKDTKDLNTKEFEDYVSKIRMWASIKLNLWLAEPNEME